MGACISSLGREGRCCCGLYAALFDPSEEQDAGSSALRASPPQSAGLLGGSSSGSSVATVCSAPPDRYLQPAVSGSRSEKFAVLQTGNSETLQGSNGASGGGGGLIMHSVKGADFDQGKKTAVDVNRFQQSYMIEGTDSLIPLIDDEDICPTCLEGYHVENPKINTNCGHHFHLACILEWMERRNHCPICNKEMVFNESP